MEAKSPTTEENKGRGELFEGYRGRSIGADWGGSQERKTCGPPMISQLLTGLHPQPPPLTKKKKGRKKRKRKEK